VSVTHTAKTTAVSTLLCPSDPSPPVAGYGRANSRFSIGPSSAAFPLDPESASSPFTALKVYRPADFSDGLSSTVGVSERLQGDWTKSTIKNGGDSRLGSLDSDHVDRNRNSSLTYCASLSSRPMEGAPGSGFESQGGETWLLSGYHFTWHNHVTTPNRGDLDRSFDNYSPSLPSRILHFGVFSATSFHRGGVNMLTLDRGVHFVRDAVSPEVWRGLATRSGGEAVSID
jgi:hypothetical protein